MDPTHRWARNLHVYTSMVALVLVLFFSISGITLNHPSWTFGDDAERSEDSGDLPFETRQEDGAIAYLQIAEFARAEHGFSGEVDSFSETAGDISIAFKKPGYAAEIVVDVDDASYRTVVDQEGWVAVMNDLHKGRDSGSSWKWAIDISAGLLILISITGLVMQLYLRKRRTSALWSVAGGTVVTIALIWWALA